MCLITRGKRFTKRPSAWSISFRKSWRIVSRPNWAIQKPILTDIRYQRKAVPLRSVGRCRYPNGPAGNPRGRGKQRVPDRNPALLRELARLGLRPGVKVVLDPGVRNASLLLRIGSGEASVRLNKKLVARDLHVLADSAGVFRRHVTTPD